MSDETDALVRALGISNGTHVWVEYQGPPDGLLRTLHAAGFQMISEGTQPGCTGDYGCPAPAHLHGCFSDTGACSDPTDHQQHAPTTADQINAAARAIDPMAWHPLGGYMRVFGDTRTEAQIIHDSRTRARNIAIEALHAAGVPIAEGVDDVLRTME